ncbi:OmpA family protein [Brachyspira aalborgi]|uniref:OmpA family protein n=1 Tax=Brachyspira aalborgi TaxID=29522 RepID=A0A5C8D7B2_9SPIR|nr:OmpA family protein [Brachyspira aalborgi]TXJ20978.1 OmpA family protein [Brachyspira aalborgi]
MLKKVFIIIIIILSFVFYGCSSTPDARNSTVLLYLSHKVEGPIYIPRADSGKEYDKPVDNTKASKKEKAKADTSKKEDKTTATKTTKTDAKEDKTKTATAKADTSKTEDKTKTATAKADTSKKQQEKVDSSKKEDKTTAKKTTKTDTKEDKKKTATAKADTSKTEDKTKTTTATAKADTSKKQQEKVDSSKRNDITYYTTNTYNGYQTRVTDGRGEMLILEKPIRFAFEKYNVTSDYNESIKYVADYLKENTNVRMVVEGHTDRVGPKKFNKGLSSRRSRAVITKLTRAGIKKDRLISSGVDFRYLEYNLNRLNRRVEFIIIRDDEDLANYKEKVE